MTNNIFSVFFIFCSFLDKKVIRNAATAPRFVFIKFHHASYFFVAAPWWRRVRLVFFHASLLRDGIRFFILVEQQIIWLFLFALFFTDISSSAARGRTHGGSGGHGSDHVPIDKTPNEPAGCTGSSAGSGSSGRTAGPAGNKGQAAEENGDYNDIARKMTIFCCLDGHGWLLSDSIMIKTLLSRIGCLTLFRLF
jgi:hypothetical protein